jgi:hypothetical protein
MAADGDQQLAIDKRPGASFQVYLDVGVDQYV